MKKIIFAFILLGWQLVAHAQEKAVKTPEEKAKHLSEKWAKDLSLSEDQKNKLYTIAFSNIQSIEKTRAQNSSDKAVKHAEMKVHRENFENEVRAILTKDQLVKWDQLRADRKARRMAHRNHDKK